MAVDGVETDIRALVEEEQGSWGELQSLLASIPPEQAERPGYFVEGWSAKDLLAHIAGWLAEAGLVLEQIRVGTFNGKDEAGVPLEQKMDIEAMNAVFLEANRSQPMRVVHAEASSARTRLLGEVGQLVSVTSQAEVWLRKAGPDHYAEHLPRLREWVTEQRA
jgi:Mycothiol maleylpyruvate isomerase N-terminal domain